MAPATSPETDEAAPALSLINPDGTFDPIKVGKRPPQMVDLFELDGRTYRIPRKPSAVLVLNFIRESRNPKMGPDLAVENLLIRLIGQTAWDALAESPEVDAEDVASILALVGQVALGEVKKYLAASGNS